VASLIYAYRSRGHLAAHMDPLSDPPPPHPDLSLEAFELGADDLEVVFDTGHLGGPKRAPLREIISILRQTYCRSVGVEYVHVQDVRMRRWLQTQMEPTRLQPSFDSARKREILELLTDAETFERFLHTRYRGQKRFSLEGAETLIPTLHGVVELAPTLGVEEVVLGMSHRGRLNVLANILDKSHEEIFAEFEDNFIPDSFAGDSDVKYHKGFSADHVNSRGHRVHLSLSSNPSHLEAVDPVVQGKARAKQRQRDDTARRQKVLPVLLHGDAAFAGQGVVAETLNLSQLEGYHTGGTLHLIVNNNIGFTTLPSESRSSVYATDVAKMVEAPIFHVNGDNPEAACLVAELALRFRQEFGRDVVVDMYCYRRHGHNEGDEPAFTQPLLYDKISTRPSVRQLYSDQLVREDQLAADEAKRLSEAFEQELQSDFEAVKLHKPSPRIDSFNNQWRGIDPDFSFAPTPTQVDLQALVEVGRGLNTIPEGFTLNPKVARQLPRRLQAVEQGGTVDWGYAEALAIGSLLLEGTPVRLSGQDSERGTFSHRHAVWSDTQTGSTHVPANHLRHGQARFCVYNSSLSEASVLGFDYGYSLAEPHMLIMWEAQFGDFVNGAQVIIDQFIVAAQAKWSRASGLVMLLPHGYEGQGPEHSNAYLERYLAACAEDNIQVCNLTTPAQYFHALRRQVRRTSRRPLIVMSPKSLLRHKRAASPVSELVDGGFAEIIDDPSPPPSARRLVLCSGKLFYDLLEAREAGSGEDVALIRVEQLFPLHEAMLREVLDRYGTKAELVWAQEEPQNRGGWSYIWQRLAGLLPERSLRYVGRPASASPATGSLRRHKAEQAELVSQALAG